MNLAILGYSLIFAAFGYGIFFGFKAIQWFIVASVGPRVAFPPMKYYANFLIRAWNKS